MRTIAVIGRKGGSGKSTLSVHLAIGLRMRGRETTLVDIDPQRSATRVLSGRVQTGPKVVSSSAAKLFALQVALVREGCEAMVIDTPAVLEEDIAQAVVLSDLALLIIRPTFLDIAAAVRTSEIIRTLRKPSLVVLNQAPFPRGAVESPTVLRAIEALQLLRLPVAPTIIRARIAFQAVLESGRSVEELKADNLAAKEMQAFCDFIQHLAFAPRKGLLSVVDEDGGA